MRARRCTIERVLKENIHVRVYADVIPQSSWSLAPLSTYYEPEVQAQ
jgi:hypothetical protein